MADEGTARAGVEAYVREHFPDARISGGRTEGDPPELDAGLPGLRSAIPD